MNANVEPYWTQVYGTMFSQTTNRQTNVVKSASSHSTTSASAQGVYPPTVIINNINSNGNNNTVIFESWDSSWQYGVVNITNSNSQNNVNIVQIPGRDDSPDTETPPDRGGDCCEMYV